MLYTIYSKFEDGVNSVLFIIQKKLLGLISLLTPAIVKKSKTRFQTTLHHLKDRLKSFFISQCLNIKIFFTVKLGQALKNALAKMKGGNFKEKLGLFKTKLQAVKIQVTDKKAYSKFTIIQTIFTSNIEKIRLLLKNTHPSTLMVIGGFLVLVPLTLALIGVESRKIYMSLFPPTPQEDSHDRRPGQEETVPRPFYYKGENKLYSLQKITLPIIFETERGTRNIRSIFIDIWIETSNRYLVLYMGKKEHEVRDFLNSNFQPILLEFPLQEEGKQILRDKIRVELNNYLQIKKIRGKVLKVYIHGIIMS